MKARNKSRRWDITAFVLLVGSVLLLLYPTVSKVINQTIANQTIGEFKEIVEIINSETDIGEKVKEESTKGSSDNSSNDDHTDYIVKDSDYTLTLKDIEALWQESQRYNDALKEQQSFADGDFSSAAVNLHDYGIHNGVYGYVSIPDINLQMPILLGSSNENMSAGITHLYGTSLPTGGTDTNCVLAGHTGFTGKIFFDDLPKLKTGSIITVSTFFGKQEYEVTKIKKIDITETNDLFIQKGSDKLTLLTCADGGLKRWQVTCYRKSE